MSVKHVSRSAAGKAQKKGRFKSFLRREGSSLLMLAPFTILFFLFTVLPIAAAIVLSFTYFNMGSAPTFVGFDNYVRMFFDDQVFLIALRNTAIFAMITGPLSYILSFFTAWLINEFPRAIRTVLTLIFYLPSLAGNVYFVWRYIFSGDSYGFLNSLLMKLSIINDPILEAIPYFEQYYGGNVEVIYAAWNDMLSTVISMQESNTAPDLFEVYDETLYSVILSGVAMNLDDYVTDQDMDYYKIRKSTFQWKGSTYAIPLKPYAFYIMFNRDLFEKEGLDAPDKMFQDGNWNWTTFRDVCKKLTKTENGEVTQLAYGSWQDTILSFMYANGGSLLNVDTETGTVTSNLNSVPTQNTLNYLVELKDNFVYGEDMFGWFDNGNLAMIRGKEYPVDLPFDTGMVPFPTGDDYEGKNLVVYPQAMAVPTGSDNPQGAVAFMRIVNELQQVEGNAKEAARIGQKNYDMIYADDVNYVYNYDKGLNDIGTDIATIVNYIQDGVPAATIYANVESTIEAEIELMYGSGGK